MKKKEVLKLVSLKDVEIFKNLKKIAEAQLFIALFVFILTLSFSASSTDFRVGCLASGIFVFIGVLMFFTRLLGKILLIDTLEKQEKEKESENEKFLNLLKNQRETTT